MSISNLKKHNAAIEKMDAIAGLTKQNEVKDHIVVSVKKSDSVRKTRQAARSPSPTASSCVSESTIASVVSTTNGTKTRGATRESKAKAATKQETQEVGDSNDKFSEKCSEWVYDGEYNTTTLTEQWQMVCDKASWRSNVQMVYFSGYLVGSIIMGILADM